jgi:hypothetical protein
MVDKWEPTRYGGFRRTGVPQSVEDLPRFDEGENGQVAPDTLTGVVTPKYKASLDTRRAAVVRFHPPVLGEIRISWREQLGLEHCPYLIRWGVETCFGSIRIHKWLGPDDDRAFHDHPWWFLTFVLRGGYTDKSPLGEEWVGAPAIRFRQAFHQHTVVPGQNGALTLLITGPKIRAWGFWKDGKFRKANKWFATYGHHPCSELDSNHD